jgi:hypothetical protein
MSTEIVNVCEYEEAAKHKLPKMVFDYYASGAEDQWTLKENREAFERIRSVPVHVNDDHLLNLAGEFVHYPPYSVHIPWECALS